MRITIICPVRNGTPEAVYQYVERLESEGHTVYFPPRDTPQDDDTGLNICLRMAQQIRLADRVDIWYATDSQGVHFDLGCAFILGKQWKLLNPIFDGSGKSYRKVIRELDMGLDPYPDGDGA